MPAKTNTRIVLQSRPKGPIEPETFKTDKSEAVPTEKDLKDGEVVVRVMWISLASPGSLSDVSAELMMVGCDDTGCFHDHLVEGVQE